MKLRRMLQPRNLFVLAIFSAFLFAGIIWFSYESSRLATVMAASIAAIAFIFTAASAFVVQQRAQFANSFAIAEKWDEEPLLEARALFRKHGIRAGDPLVLVKDDLDYQLAVIHMLNFYWNIAAAIRTDWADPEYLGIRFHRTLDNHYPAMLEFAEKVSKDRLAANDAIEAIEGLRSLWKSMKLAESKHRRADG
jgi:hypothetical protein